MAPEEYCREVESYLCRKNGGHLIRIVGPAFEEVRGWAEQGIPLTVAFRGIDRYCDRHARGSARGRRSSLQARPDRPARSARPVRIEFCAADVLDAFDEWRRAVGIASAQSDGAERRGAAAHRGSLAPHLERVAARLTTAVAAERLPPALRDVIEAALGEVDQLRGRAKGLRGDARARALDRLRELDVAIMAAARTSAAETLLAEVALEADTELAPFAGRLSDEAWARASKVCRDRLLRDRLGLPAIAID
jgi:hypothetical protein